MFAALFRDGRIAVLPVTIASGHLGRGEPIMAGEHFDHASEPGGEQGRAGQGRRPFIGIHFACCNVYARLYVNRQGTAFVGHCPRCARRTEMRIGPGGSEQRFYRAE